MADTRPASRRGWRLLLLPQPPLLLAYLYAVRADLVWPRFGPVVAVTLLPAAAVVLAARARAGWLVVLGLAEVAWGVLTAAMIGFAIAWRSG